MSVDANEVEALARAFACHLEHLREFRGVCYVSAAPLPRDVEAGDVEAGDVEAGDVEAAPQPHELGEAPPRESDEAPRPRAAGEAPQPRAAGGAPRDPAPALQPHDAATKSVGNPSPPQSSHPRPDHPQSSPANRDVSVSSSSPLRAAAREVIRSRAEQWPASRKLQYLRERNVGDCQRCPLAKTRRNIVFGVGDPEAELMFIGEAPGGDEDRLGEPFVGAAGKRLDRWIERLGLRREQVYIANVLKCRPPGNRDPKQAEIDRCSPFLHAQIRAVEPKVIVALGRFAGCLLLDRDLRMYQMRGQVHHYREPKSGAEVPLLVTYHPSYVIRREREPRDARAAQAKPDRGGVIKSEDEKVLADLERALSLVQASRST